MTNEIPRCQFCGDIAAPGSRHVKDCTETARSIWFWAMGALDSVSVFSARCQAIGPCWYVIVESPRGQEGRARGFQEFRP